MKILVTGGAGFIGSNLCEHLLHEGHSVRCLDNFATGKQENIFPLLEKYPETFQLQVGDIRNLADCQKAMVDMEYVLHEAALGSVPRSIKDPITTNEVNIGGFLNMIMASRDAGIKRFVFAASSSTYGDSQSLPKVEDVIGKPLSPYAITKYVNELYAENFHSLYGIDTVGLRYFNVFGRRQDPDGAYAAVIPKFVRCLLRHESPVINGDGSFSRDFTYVENVVLANQLALLAEAPEAVNQVYNIASGERMTLNELFSCLRDNLTALDGEIGRVNPVYGPVRAGDIPHSQACIEKARERLGYAPVFDVRSGLREATKWYFENL